MNHAKLHSLLVRCQLERITDRGTNIMACCPAHGEREPSWGIQKAEPHLHGCFVCGYKGSIVTLLRDQLKISTTKAAQLAEVNLSAPQARDLFIVVERDDDNLTVEEEWSTYVPADEAYRYLLKRGVSKKQSMQMEVRYDFEQERVLFPWRSHGQLVGFTGRLISPDADPAHKTIPYAHMKKGKFLYFPARKFSTKDRRWVIVEGEIDAATVAQDVTPNVAGLGFGTFTDAQAKVLLSKAPKEVVVFTDHDKAGERIADHIEEKIGDFVRIRRVEYSYVKASYPKKAKLDPAALRAEHRVKLIEKAGCALCI